MKNKSIVLIGMPGCGKSTLGLILAERLGYNFIDMDRFIEEYSEEKIPELFKISEEYFRDIESEVCSILGKKTNVVIASGGGIVKREKNIESLKYCIIIYLDRDLKNILSDIKVENRPLLKDDKSKIFNLYNERSELYNKYSNFIVDNNKTIENTIDNIINNLK